MSVYSYIFGLLLVVQSTMAAVECTSAEKSLDGTSKHTIRYYKPNELGRNQFANVQLFETAKMSNQGYLPVTYTLCVAKPNGYGSIVRCESEYGSDIYLMIENVRKTGAYQDGLFKLFNLSCRDI